MNRVDDLSHFALLRHRMVEEQLLTRDIFDPQVLQAMRAVPRELFVPVDHRDQAYSDGPLEIGFGQTISQPYVVASMTQALHLSDDSKVLEIGTGSGYQTAVLAQLAGSVHTIELVPELGARAQEVIGKLGCANVNFRIGDGKLGWPEEAPFDAILVAAAAEAIPDAWLEQLAVGGRLVGPVTVDGSRQELRLLRKTTTGVEIRVLYEVRFVPLK